RHTHSEPWNRTVLTQHLLLPRLVPVPWHLRASNIAPRTISTYLGGVTQLAQFLEAHGMPTNVAGIRRERIEAFLVDLLSRFKPGIANNRHRCLQAFFKFLREAGEITQSPMARM